ncbi:hypothetical protein COOONC_16555, partial [Cooperia oncophora]
MEKVAIITTRNPKKKKMVTTTRKLRMAMQRRYNYDDNHEEGHEETEEPEYEDHTEPEPEPEEAPENNEVIEPEKQDDDDYGAEEQVESHETNAEDSNAAGDSGGGGGFGSLVKGALDGFGSSNIGDIVGSISQIAGGEGGLTTIMSSGGYELTETGAIIGAIAGNLIFNMGGRGNSLTSIGKVILDNIISGKYKRDVSPFLKSTV